MSLIFDSSLVLYLPLYEADGASFMSRDKHGHLCSATGARWTARGGSFDGNDDLIDCGNPAAVAFNGVGMTLEVWFNTTETGTPKRLIGYDTPGNPRYMLSPYMGDVVTMYLHDGTNLISISGSTNIADGNWHHAAFSYLDGTGYLLVNCVEEARAVQAISGFSASGLYIGAYSYGSPAEHYQGLIGEVRIYNRGLTRQEIEHNYLATRWRYQ